MRKTAIFALFLSLFFLKPMNSSAHSWPAGIDMMTSQSDVVIYGKVLETDTSTLTFDNTTRDVTEYKMLVEKCLKGELEEGKEFAFKTRGRSPRVTTGETVMLFIKESKVIPGLSYFVREPRYALFREVRDASGKRELVNGDDNRNIFRGERIEDSISRAAKISPETRKIIKERKASGPITLESMEEIVRGIEETGRIKKMERERLEKVKEEGGEEEERE